MCRFLCYTLYYNTIRLETRFVYDQFHQFFVICVNLLSNCSPGGLSLSVLQSLPGREGGKMRFTHFSAFSSWQTLQNLLHVPISGLGWWIVFARQVVRWNDQLLVGRHLIVRLIHVRARA